MISFFDSSQRRGSNAALGIERKRLVKVSWRRGALRWGKAIDRDAPANGEAAGTRGETCRGVGPFLQGKSASGTSSL